MPDFKVTSRKEVDIEASLEFAKKLMSKSSENNLFLVSIPVDTVTYSPQERHLSGIKGKTFTPLNIEELIPWLQERNGKCGIYWHVNTIRKIDEDGNPIPISTKASKEDVYEMRYLHIDIDPELGETIEDARTRGISLLEDPPSGIPRPTFAISSGGGIQGFWELDKPILINNDLSVCEEMERYNLQLNQHFGGDHCHNLDRILRWVGTINVPNQKKIAKGQLPQLAEIIWDEPDRIFSLDDFKKAPKLADRETRSSNNRNQREAGIVLNISGNVKRVDDLNDLTSKEGAPVAIENGIKDLIQSGYRPQDGSVNQNRVYQGRQFESRSEALFEVLRHLVNQDVTDEDMYAIITDQNYAISESVRDKRMSMDKYAKRQIRRARVFHEDSTVGQMNDRHAVLTNSGGRATIMTEGIDEKGRKSVSYQRVDDLKIIYKNRPHLGVDGQGNPREYDRVEHWLKSRFRREYKNTLFSPARDVEGYFNLYQGFSVEPNSSGSCNLYLDHILHNLCTGVEEYYDYICNWMARLIQKPASRSEVALVFQGEQGTGKTVFADHLGYLVGRHYIPVSDAEHLVGRFNSHLQEALLIFSDEAFFAKNLKHQSVLKTLITGQDIPIEPKYMAVRIVDNHTHLIMSSNNAHVIPAALDERRFFCLVVSDLQKRNSVYFEKVETQMKKGGYEALLYFLLNRDISKFNVRDVPETDALREQKLMSMRDEEKFWFQCLSDGKQRKGDPIWREAMSTEDFHSYYLNFCDRHKINRILTKAELLKVLEFKMMPKSTEKVKYGKSRRKLRIPPAPTYNEEDYKSNRISSPRSAFIVPSLEDCRNLFSEKYTGSIIWDTDLEDEGATEVQSEIPEEGEGYDWNDR